MTYCTACGKSINHPELDGAVKGQWLDFKGRYIGREDIVLWFCDKCWERLKKQGIRP